MQVVLHLNLNILYGELHLLKQLLMPTMHYNKHTLLPLVCDIIFHFHLIVYNLTFVYCNLGEVIVAALQFLLGTNKVSISTYINQLLKQHQFSTVFKATQQVGYS